MSFSTKSDDIMIGHIGIVEQVEATSKLRWKGRVLQQAWRVVTWESGMVKDQRLEWRDVPSEN